MPPARKPVLPDVFGRKLGWRERFLRSTEWMFRPMPKTQAELGMEAEAEARNAPKDTIRLNLHKG